MRARAVALALALLGLTAPAAQAETWSARDARGDAETLVYSPDPPPCGTSTLSPAPTARRQDLTALRVDHGSQAVVIRLRMADVARRDHSTSWSVHLLTPDRGYLLVVFPRRPGEAVDAFLSEEPEVPANPDPADCTVGSLVIGRGGCDGLSVHLDAAADRLDLTVPRRCLGRPRWVRVGADVSGAFTGSAETGYSVTGDTWSPGAATAYPIYGPRVHAG
ncbi:hypothetical protein G5V58_10575 [Nocardioides anomalus]|uniref:DUF4384 domain-containing protein n=1 Tax=Nocardioides anomalus TaxID=2712223 RepID=A0A6G6WDG7_9ACTN|nr:hypothetical protein [Nocardioides anomalus]QIG43145.1 hypothetical protein G5V58_10575 [Nocardioides anomalus]